MAKAKKHYVAGPNGRAPTEEEALEMGRQMFDVITTQQAKDARKK